MIKIFNFFSQNFIIFWPFFWSKNRQNFGKNFFFDLQKFSDFQIFSKFAIFSKKSRIFDRFLAIFSLYLQWGKNRKNRWNFPIFEKNHKISGTDFWKKPKIAWGFLLDEKNVAHFADHIIHLLDRAPRGFFAKNRRFFGPDLKKC